MANLREEIKKQYGVDIARDNIPKLYKIENETITNEKLEELIAATRKRWEMGVNGANEKIAERDRTRLSKANQYEAILRNAELRKKLFDYFSGNESSTEEKADSSHEALEFARTFFRLISSTKKIRKKDVEFFFDYFTEQRKYKKDVLAMLSGEFKVKALGNEKSYANEEQEDVHDTIQKHKSEVIVVNFFQRDTLLKIQKCVNYLETAAQSRDVVNRYPTVEEDLYEYLEMKTMKGIDDFKERIVAKSKEVYSIRQERGAEYIPLVDLLNAMQTLSKARDVVDNFDEFRLLVKYPKLTPYMYSFVEMKPETISDFFGIANKDYVFRDNADFLLNYYLPLSDNFGITNSSIKKLLEEAKKNAGSNRVWNTIDEKLGRMKKRKMSFLAELLYYLAWYPLLLAYLLFGIVKLVFNHLGKLAIPLFLFGFIWSAHFFLFPELSDALYTKVSGFVSVIESIIGFLLTVGPSAIVGLFFAFLTSELSEELKKGFDWIGYKRTFQKLIGGVRKKTEDEFFADKSAVRKKMMSAGVVNLVCLLAIVLFFCWLF